MIRYISIIAGLFLLCSCGVKTNVILLPDADGKTGAVTVKNDTSSVVLDQPYTATRVKSNRSTLHAAVVEKKTVEDKYQTLFQAEPLKPISILLYFEFNSNQLNPASAKLIPEVIRLARERVPCEINIIGHSDTKGTAEYNYDLALDRAQHVADLLKEAGIRMKNLTVTSHGEKDLLIMTGDDVYEEKNRRVEVMIR